MCPNMTDRTIQLNTSNDHQADQNYFITRSVVLISILCVLPLLFMLIGLDFSTEYEALDPEWVYELNKTELQEAAHSALRGSITHTLLEWTALCAAFFVGLLAFVQYRLTREPSLPIIGMALVCAGAMDGFHTFAADRLIHAVADNRDLIPFTWAICRLFNGIILLIGVGIFAFSTRKITRLGNGVIIGICTSFVLIAYVVISKCAASGALPQTMFPDSAIKRPYDIYPLIPYVLCGLVVFPKYLKRYPGIFGFTLMLALIPAISTQLYMALGSVRLHDSCFNIAHALKAVSYMVPLIGLLAKFMFIHKERVQAQQKLQIQVMESTLLHRVSAVASESETVEEATQKCIDLICESIGWPIGHVYMMSEDDNATLETTDIWYLADQDAFAAFRSATKQTKFSRGVGLPGKVLQTGEPEWIVDITSESNFLRVSHASDIGVKSAFAFPIKIRGETMAVLEFFTNETLAVDKSMLRLASSVGEQLGRVFERKQARLTAEKNREYAESIIATVRNPLVVLDSELKVISASPSFYQVFHATARDTINKFIYELGTGQWNISDLCQQLKDIITIDSTLTDVEVDYDFPTIGRKVMQLNARRVIQEAGRSPKILLSIQDITERKNSQDKLDHALKDTRQHLQEVERFNRLANGREKRMIELKQEVNELLAAQGVASKYHSNEMVSDQSDSEKETALGHT